MIGDELRARMPRSVGRTEVAVAVHALNRMLELGHLQATSAWHDARRGWGYCARFPVLCNTLKPVQCSTAQDGAPHFRVCRRVSTRHRALDRG